MTWFLFHVYPLTNRFKCLADRLILTSGLVLLTSPAVAQTQEVLPSSSLPQPPEVIRPRQEALPEIAPSPQESLDVLPRLPEEQETPSSLTNHSEEMLPITRFYVDEIQIRGNTAFDDETLEGVVREVLRFPSDSITLADLFLAAENITRHYEKHQYPTTGAAPLIAIEGSQFAEVAPNGVVTFEVFEGEIVDIEVSGTRRLTPNYVSARLALATDTPLNSERLREALQLLHDDPLIETLQATVAPGTTVGTNTLRVNVQEADSFEVGAFLDNQRSTFVGTLQRGVQLSERNLLGFGDRLTLSYNNTDGSDGFSVGYGIPLNPHQGTLTFRYSQTDNDLIDSQVESLGINSRTEYYDLSWRQPLIRSPEQEFALGVTGSLSHNRAVFGEDIFGFATGFPSPGADEDGRSQVTAIRFFQDWVSRSQADALAVRSQFSLGLGDFLGGTVNADAPDSRFFSWRGQAQYRRRLGDDTFLQARGGVQFASRPLLPAEQFGLGGRGTVRGYRQDLFLTDKAVFASAEVWLPVMRVPEVDGILHLTPFVDVGTAWDADGGTLGTGQLAAVGLGLQWQQEHISARIDWGIPLVEVTNQGNSLQANGLHFSLSITPF